MDNIDPPGQNTGVGSLSLLQGIFPTQGLNPVLPLCRWIIYQWSHTIHLTQKCYKLECKSVFWKRGVAGRFRNTTANVLMFPASLWLRRIFPWVCSETLSRTWWDDVWTWPDKWWIHLRCRIPGFDPWVGKIPQRRAWQPTPVFLPAESHGRRSLVGYSPWGLKRVWVTGLSD